jgi:hypothetical protein
MLRHAIAGRTRSQPYVNNHPLSRTRLLDPHFTPRQRELCAGGLADTENIDVYIFGIFEVRRLVIRLEIRKHFKNQRIFAESYEAHPGRFLHHVLMIRQQFKNSAENPPSNDAHAGSYASIAHSNIRNVRREKRGARQ